MTDEQDEDAELLAAFNTETEEICGRCEQILLEVEDRPIAKEAMDELFRNVHTVKGCSMALGLASLAELVHRWEDVLTLGRATEASLKIPDETVSLFLECTDAVRDYVRSGPGELEEHIAGLIARLAKIEDQEHWLSLVVDASELRAAEEGADEGAEDGAKAREAAAAETVRVRLDTIDVLIRRIGELSIQQQIATSRGFSGESEGAGRKLNQLCAEAYDVAMSLRMVPVHPTIQLLRRTLRDTAIKLGKRIDFVVIGAEASVDLALVQVLGEALGHLIRNAVDHGVESAAERARSTKADVATIKLTISHHGGNLEVRVEDDGRGIDAQKIRAKAIQRGLITADDQRTGHALLDLLFEPGFSTAEKVTEFSGRGVGLDVVASKIREMDGSVTVDSTLGEGSSWRILLPLSVAVVDVMQIRMDGERYLVPLQSVRETIAVEADKIYSTAGGVPLIVLRGTCIPIYRLSALLAGRVETGISSLTAVSSALLTEWQGMSFALAVDDIIGRTQVVVKPLGPELSHANGISGSAVLSNGHVGLILDLQTLIRGTGFQTSDGGMLKRPIEELQGTQHETVNQAI